MRVGYTESLNYRGLDDLESTNGYSMISAQNLDYCGHEDCLPGYQFGPYVRKSFVIHIIRKGKGIYQWKGMTYHLKKGDAFVIFPGEETLYRADEETPWSYTWVGFHGFRSEEFLDNMGFSVDRPVLQLQQVDRMKECVDRMLQNTKLSCINELRRTSQLLEIFALFMEDNQEYVSEKKNDYPGEFYVNTAISYMMHHYGEKIKIDDLADHIGISRSYLSTNFKKVVKMSPQEYLINLRMERAAEMLRHTSEPVNIVASACGYGDSLSFSKVFKQKFLVSPKTYRDTGVELEKRDEKDTYVGDHHL